MKATTAKMITDFLIKCSARRLLKSNLRHKRHLKRRHKEYIKEQIMQRVFEHQYHADISIHDIDQSVLNYFEKRGYEVTKQEHQYTVLWGHHK